MTAIDRRQIPPAISNLVGREYTSPANIASWRDELPRFERSEWRTPHGLRRSSPDLIPDAGVVERGIFAIARNVVVLRELAGGGTRGQEIVLDGINRVLDTAAQVIMGLEDTRADQRLIRSQRIVDLRNSVVNAPGGITADAVADYILARTLASSETVSSDMRELEGVIAPDGSTISPGLIRERERRVVRGLILEEARQGMQPPYGMQEVEAKAQGIIFLLTGSSSLNDFVENVAEQGLRVRGGGSEAYLANLLAVLPPTWTLVQGYLDHAVLERGPKATYPDSDGEYVFRIADKSLEPTSYERDFARLYLIRSMLQLADTLNHAYNDGSFDVNTSRDDIRAVLSRAAELIDVIGYPIGHNTPRDIAIFDQNNIGAVANIFLTAFPNHAGLFSPDFAVSDIDFSYLASNVGFLLRYTRGEFNTSLFAPRRNRSAGKAENA